MDACNNQEYRLDGNNHASALDPLQGDHRQRDLTAEHHIRTAKQPEHVLGGAVAHTAGGGDYSHELQNGFHEYESGDLT